MSNQQIEQSIRVFFDRMHELINPIDPERLKLDSVHQVKNNVKQFYKKKAEQCDKLLQELDQMNAERPTILEWKKKQITDASSHNLANLRAKGDFYDT